MNPSVLIVGSFIAPFSWPSKRWLPKKALQNIPETDDLDITAQGGVLILKPVTVDDPGSRLAVVRQKIKDLGIVQKD
jgi:hypothetical protein